MGSFGCFIPAAFEAELRIEKERVGELGHSTWEGFNSIIVRQIQRRKFCPSLITFGSAFMATHLFSTNSTLTPWFSVFPTFVLLVLSLPNLGNRRLALWHMLTYGASTQSS